MPRVFSVDKWVIYFWANESLPLEPVHVHIAHGVPKENATKVWITSAGGCIVASNGSNIPSHVLRNLMEIIVACHFEVTSKWRAFFGEISYYC